jgi:hypothetical protein
MRGWFRAHSAWTAAIVGVVALLVGVGIGSASTEDETRINDLEEQLADAKPATHGPGRGRARAEQGQHCRAEVADGRPPARR